MNKVNPISIRENQVLHLIAAEYTSKEIAQKLYISTHTADSHRKNLIEKLGVRNTAGLVRAGFEKGILTLSIFLFTCLSTSFGQYQAEFEGGIKIGNTNVIDTGGIRWNNITKDFEGFNGTEWVSFTKAEILNYNNQDSTNILPFCADTVISELSPNTSFFGHAVDIDENYAVIKRTNFPNDVIIYKFENEDWNIDSILSIPFSASGINDKILLNDSTVIIGSLSSNTNGEISIWTRNNNEVWESDTLFGETGSERFGESLAFNGKFLVVGASGTEINGNPHEGEIFIYKKVNQIWEEVANFENPDLMNDNGFGREISVSNNFILVSSSNHIYVYSITGELIQFHSTLTDVVGISMDYDGQFFIVGNAFYTDNFSQQGRVLVYNSSTLSAIDTFQVEESNHHLGSEISIDGDYMLVTARAAQDNGNGKPGLVYVYHYNGVKWELVETITDPIVEDDAQFGNSTGLHGPNYIIGVPRADINGSTDEGKVFFGTIK